MSDTVRPPFLCTLLYPLPTRPLGIDEMPAYVFQYSPGHYYEGKYAIKVKVYKEGWYRGSKYDYKTYIGEYNTWQEAVRDMRRQRRELEKKRRSRTPAPTATVPPRSTSKRKQIDWDEVIRAEAVVEAQRLELERAAASPPVDEEASGAQVAECPICLEELDDASPSLACGHRFHEACVRQLVAKAWADGAKRTRGRGTAVPCPCCRGQSYVK